MLLQRLQNKLTIAQKNIDIRNEEIAHAQKRVDDEQSAANILGTGTVGLFEAGFQLKLAKMKLERDLLTLEVAKDELEQVRASLAEPRSMRTQKAVSQ